MTFVELVAWIVSKPFGRILVERSERERSVTFYLSCQAAKKDSSVLPPPIMGIELSINHQDLLLRGGKQAVEQFISDKFDKVKRDFEVLEKT